MRPPVKIFDLTLSRFVGILLVPLTIIGVMLWGLWEPTSRLESVKAAVVNNDEPVEIDGQVTPLGRVLAAELIGTKTENFEWVLTNDEEAQKGIKNAKYVSVVTIPENFSAAATSLSDGPSDARRATVSVETSKSAKLLDAALTQAVTQAAAKILNEELGENFIGNIFVGMNDLKEGITQIERGARELANGQEQLTDGLEQLGAGSRELSTGVSQLVAGGNQLATGTQEIARGTGMFVGGVAELADGLSQLADGAQQNAAGGKQLAEGVGAYVSMINEALGYIQFGISEAETQYQTLIDEILNSEDLTDEQKEEIVAFLDSISNAIPTDLNDILDGAIAGGNDLSLGAKKAAQGSQAIADRIGEVSGGAFDLVDGASDLVTGTQELSAGASQLGSGLSQLGSEIPTLVAGVNELTEGSRQTSSGANQLADGLQQVTEDMPSYTDAERDKLAELMLNPIGLKGDSASLFTGSGAPLFLSIALWAGALVSFMLVNPFWRRAQQAAGNDTVIALKSTRFSVIGGALQGLIAGVFTAALLKLALLPLTLLVVIAMFGAIAFNLINQGLVAFFGGYGRFVSFIILIVAFTSGIISTVPEALNFLTSLTPIEPFSSAVNMVIEDGFIPGAKVLALGVWAAAGFVALWFAIRKLRRA